MNKLIQLIEKRTDYWHLIIQGHKSSLLKNLHNLIIIDQVPQEEIKVYIADIKQSRDTTVFFPFPFILSRPFSYGQYSNA